MEYGFDINDSDKDSSPSTKSNKYQNQHTQNVFDQFKDYYEEFHQQMLALEKQEQDNSALLPQLQQDQLSKEPAKPNSPSLYIHSPFSHIPHANYTQSLLGEDVLNAIHQPSYKWLKYKIAKLEPKILSAKQLDQQQFNIIAPQVVAIAQLINEQKKLTEEINAKHKLICDYPCHIQSYEPLLHDQTLLNMANISEDNPLLLELQNIHTHLMLPASKRAQWKILKLVKTTTEQIFASFSDYDKKFFQIGKQPELNNLDDLAKILPDFYVQHLGTLKYYVTDGLIDNLDMIKDQIEGYTLQQDSIDNIQATFLKNNNEYDHALSLIHATKLHHASQILGKQVLRWKLEKDQKEKIRIQAEIAEQQRQRDEKLQAEKLKKQHEKILRKQQEDAIIIAQQLAEQKRVEQSKADKERYLAEQKQLQAKTTSIKQEPKITPIKKSQQKSSKKSIDYDEDNFLNDAITANKVNSLVIKDDNKPEEAIFLPAHQPEIAKGYEHFIQLRNIKLAQVEAQKEIQRKENLRKLLKTPSEKRPQLKQKLESELVQQYAYASEDEKTYIQLLGSYLNLIKLASIEIYPLDNYESINDIFNTIEIKLQQKGEKLSWYLVCNPFLYEHIKKEYLAFKKGMSYHTSPETYRLKNQIRMLLDDSQYGLNVDKKTRILNILDNLHKIDGILDITNLIYKRVPYEKIQTLGIIKSDTLQKSSQAIENIYLDKPITAVSSSLTVPIVADLLEQAGIAPRCNLVDSIIKTSFDLSRNLPGRDYKECTEIFFYRYSRSNEMDPNSYSEQQIADIINIHICTLKTFASNVYQLDKTV